MREERGRGESKGVDGKDERNVGRRQKESNKVWRILKRTRKGGKNKVNFIFLVVSSSSPLLPFFFFFPPPFPLVPPAFVLSLCVHTHSSPFPLPSLFIVA